MTVDIQSSAKRSILCVLPNERHRPALELALSKYQLTIVPNALEAVRAHNAGSYDAYVLDYWLPDWSGPSLCRQIRQTEAHAPICFYSTAEGDDQRKRALRAGATVFLHAAGGAEILAAKIRTLLHVSDTQSLHARVEGERAVQEELQRRANIVVEQSGHARQRAQDAVQRSARVRAQKAFINAGGSLATFNRWWNGTWETAQANQRVLNERAGQTS